MCVADRDGAEFIDRIASSSRFKIEPFDTQAAIEAARVISTSLSRRDKRAGRAKATWQKVKFDRQIVAIAKTRLATEIYSDDEDVAAFGLDVGIQVIPVSELPLPPPTQAGLPLEIPEDESGSPAGSPEAPLARRRGIALEESG